MRSLARCPAEAAIVIKIIASIVGFISAFSVTEHDWTNNFVVVIVLISMIGIAAMIMLVIIINYSVELVSKQYTSVIKAINRLHEEIVQIIMMLPADTPTIPKVQTCLEVGRREAIDEMEIGKYLRQVEQIMEVIRLSSPETSIQGALERAGCIEDELHKSVATYNELTSSYNRAVTGHHYNWYTFIAGQKARPLFEDY